MASKGRLGLILATATIVLGVAGCHISADKKDGKDNVSIETPLGGLNVKTDSSRVLGKVGLPQYPGSHPEQKKAVSDDKDSADVDMSFGSFHLRVLAASFETADSPAKVEAFYRQPLAQFSDVIACRNQQPIGTPVKTGLGLTCADDKHTPNHKHMNINVNDDEGNELELKAGSPSRQHIVGIRSTGNGTLIKLVALDLPRDSKDSD